MIPQLILIVLGMLGLGITITKHGKPKNGNYNGWVSFFAIMIEYFLLLLGGFFDCFFI